MGPDGIAQGIGHQFADQEDGDVAEGSEPPGSRSSPGPARAMRTAPGSAGNPTRRSRLRCRSRRSLPQAAGPASRSRFRGVNRHIPDIPCNLPLPRAHCGTNGVGAAHQGAHRPHPAVARERPLPATAPHRRDVLVQPVDVQTSSGDEPAQVVVVLKGLRPADRTAAAPSTPAGRTPGFSGHSPGMRSEGLGLDAELLAELPYEGLLRASPGSTLPPGSSQRPASSGGRCAGRRGGVRRAAGRRPPPRRPVARAGRLVRPFRCAGAYGPGPRAPRARARSSGARRRAVLAIRSTQ